MTLRTNTAKFRTFAWTALLLLAVQFPPFYFLGDHDLMGFDGGLLEGVIHGGTALLCALLVTALVSRRLKRLVLSKEAESAFTLKAIPDGVMTLTECGVIVSANPAAAAIFGYERYELVGLNVRALMPEPYSSGHDEALRIYHARGSRVIGMDREVTAMRADGSTFPLEIRVSVLPEGSTSYFIGIMRDATEVHEASQELQAALREAQEATRCRSEFLANISHEIRTPMMAIIGYGEIVALDDIGMEKRKEAGDAILRSSNHLLALINDILDFSKLDAGKMTPESLHVCPFELAEGVREIMLKQAERKGLRLVFDYKCDLPELVETDPTMLRQALLNLVGNAIKFTASGEVRVTVQMEAGRRSSHSPLLQFAVSDTGIGIPAEAIERLFDPFEQADTSTVREFGGTGLGLSISSIIATVLGGELTVASVVGEGSCFTLTTEAGVLVGVKSLSVGEWRSSRLDKQIKAVQIEFAPGTRVLLAEDNAINQKILRHMLEQLGLEVTSAFNGKEGMEAAIVAFEEGRPFELVLMDMQMPILDGWTATEILREYGYMAPIVALTANATEADRQRCLKAGCDDFASKPISREQLAQLLSKYLPSPSCPSA